LKATDILAREAKGINAAAKEIGTNVIRVNDTTNTIASTTETYRDVLLTQPM
jgi:aspartate carbamoyltransferase catalytic subunit